MNDEFKRLWALLICQIWAKYHIGRTRQQQNWSRPTEEELNPGYLFGHYLMVEPGEFRTWLVNQRWGDNKELTDYQCSFFEYLKEMVDDIYPDVDRSELGMALIYGEETREDVATILNLMPSSFLTSLYDSQPSVHEALESGD